MWRVESKKEQVVEGEFGEEAPKSGQKAEAKWMQSECRVNAKRIV